MLYPTRKFYFHDADNKQTFYDQVMPVYLTFVVTGLTGEGSLATFEKIFEALEILMNKVELHRIIFETASQTSDYEFGTEDSDNNELNFYKWAEYVEDKWKVPVIQQTGSTNVDFEKYSDTRGQWVKITLVYDPGSDPQEIVIRSVKTFFNISIA